MPTGIVKQAKALSQRAPQAGGHSELRKAKSAAASFHAYVAVRVRPPENSQKSLVQYPGNANLAFNWQGMQRQFSFDVVFEEAASQHEVFDNCGVKDLIQLALEGYNCTCFAYGQTNSGKTYTMTGPPDETLQFGVSGLSNQSKGLVPRSFAHIFELLRSRGSSGFKVYATYFEIYNEQITDLLNPRSIYPHTIRWSATSGFYVDNLFVIECDSPDDLIGVLAAGLANRRMDRGSHNDYSSRSHSLFSIMIDTQAPGDVGSGQAIVTRHGKLTFVDLAGSESTSGAREPDQMLETSTINKSLLVLGNCISALADPKKRAGHVPYRDSKLTKLLSDSLGGSGVSLMIACINPSPEQGAETINTLRYASRAKRIEVCPEVNLDPQEKLLHTLKQEVASLRQENSSLREQLRASAAQSEAGGGVGGGGRGDAGRIVKSREASPGSSDDRSNPAQQAAARPVSKGSYQSLYEMLQEYMQENETLRSENLDLDKHQTDYRLEQRQLAEENRRLASQLSRMRREFVQQQKKQQQQQQQQRKTPVYVVSNPETPTLLPSIEAGVPPVRASARLPPRSPRWSLPPADSRELQPGRRPQPPFEFAPTPPLPYFDTDRQPRPIPMPPPPPLPPPPHTHREQPQPYASSSRLMYPEAPVYVPQPGERTYRDRFEAVAGRDKLRGGGHGDGANFRTVQELARLNANLRGELRQLDGAIQQHQRVNALQNDIRRNEGRKVLSF